jgi:ribosome-associated protein
MPENSTLVVALKTPFIELDKLLKRENLTASGGEARYLISEGCVQVNGQVETRKRRKLYTGDTVYFNGLQLRVQGGGSPADPEQGLPGKEHVGER